MSNAAHQALRACGASFVILAFQPRHRGVPADQMGEEGIDEGVATILIVEVVGVLPNVAAGQRNLAFRQSVTARWSC